jgi:hypothetical protein
MLEHLAAEPVSTFLPIIQIALIAAAVLGMAFGRDAKPEHQICPRCGEPWAEKRIAKEEKKMDIAFDWNLVNKAAVGQHLEGLAVELAKGTPNFAFDDMLAPFVAEVFAELVAKNANPATLMALATTQGTKRDEVLDLFKQAGVTKAVPAWLLNLLLPLAIEQIQKLIEKWFKK